MAKKRKVNKDLDHIYNYKNELTEQLSDITRLLKESNKSIARYKDKDDKNLCVYSSTIKGKENYYIYDKRTKKKSYVKREDEKNLKKYIQRDYDLAVNDKLKKIQNSLLRLLKIYDIEEIYNTYEGLKKSKKEMVVPIIKSKEEYIEEWYKLHPAMQNTYPQDGQYKTNNNEYVRSKSEKIIADLLFKYNIPYAYEPRLELSNFSTVYPDFAALNLRTGHTYYWEHLGLISEYDYATKNFSKIQDYIGNGLFPGKDLILSMESEGVNLDIKTVERMIESYLL